MALPKLGIGVTEYKIHVTTTIIIINTFFSSSSCKEYIIITVEYGS